MTDKGVDTLEINSNCGLHIHFSPVSCPLAQRGVSYSDLSAIRRLWTKRVKAKFPRYADAILGQYNRDYARRASSLTGFMRLGHRAEFNISEYKGIEWRGFNALGVASGRRGEFEKDFKEVGKVLYEGLLVIREVLSKSCGRGYLFATRPKRIKIKDIPAWDTVRAIEREFELSLNIASTTVERVREVLIG